MIEIAPRGPFSLAAAMEFAGGFPAGIGGGGVGVASITLAFPVEGVDASAASCGRTRTASCAAGPMRRLP